jgi:hypothetical protein
MKNAKLYILLILVNLFISRISFPQEWESINYAHSGITIDFLNSNTGYIGVLLNLTEGNRYAILKTTNKGTSFSTPIWEITSNSDNSKGFAFDMVNELLGFVYVGGYLYKTTNGGNNWTEVFGVSYTQSALPTIKFFNENLGFITYTQENPTSANSLEVWRITNSGLNRSRVYQSPADLNVPVITDITISQTDPNQILMVGYYYNFNSQGQIGQFALTSSNGGGGFGREFVYVSVSTKTTYSNALYLDGSFTEYRILGTEYYGVNDIRNGSYCYYSIEPLSPKYKVSNLTDNIGGLSFVDHDKGYSYIHNKLYRTSNSGVNWSEIYTFSQGSFFNRNSLKAYNDIIYCVEAQGNFLTHKLSTNLNTNFDNQSTTSSIFFDSTVYPSPSTQYLRGGNCLVYSNLPYIINLNQNDEKIFYKWSNGNMDFSNHNYYFDMSGTTIANYYKTKQLASSPLVISNKSQVYSLKDTLNGINQIYESMGGMFFSKSYNNGNTFKQEEIANYSESISDGNSNKNPSIYEVRDNTQYGRPVTVLDRNKNIVACWERFNQTTGKTEIKVSGRNYTLTPPDTVFLWSRWNLSGDDIFTSFNSNSNFNSYPKVFAIALSPFSNLGELNTYFLIVPHLRPASNGVKVQVTARSTLNKYSEFSIDSGEVADLSVINIANQHGYIELYLTYKKSSQIIFRKIYLEDYYTYPIIMINLEGPVNISSGDGYTSRSKPDISLMNGVPVVSYAANYNANIFVEYEQGGTDIIPIHRYPIVKVQRVDADHWNNYVIYNSAAVQDNPDIEGSTDTKSYLINYSIGSGQFKKVVSVFEHPGYFCEPNIFNGTDSKLIKNSYSGLYGSNLSLLTLSPNSGLFKLDKQSFNITNINSADNVDNLEGVVNLDTVRYSFNLGPILIKEDEEYIDPNFNPFTDTLRPLISPVEFNQNLRSNSFSLNETQALLLGCNVTYIKDDIDAVVNPVKYSVNLMNKSSGLLHRVLYADTIHLDDSIATEFLRGYFITDIPNGEDSFYVQISVNNNDIAGGNYFINPGYSDGVAAGDNSVRYKTKIVFEKDNIQYADIRNTTNSIPNKFSLSQNYPNPFNPVTKIKYELPASRGERISNYVSLKVYDVSGKEVKTIVNENQIAGAYEVTFDAANYSSGVYFYRLETNGFSETMKMLLIK